MWIPRSETWIEQVTGIPGEAAALRLLWHVGAAGGLERLFFRRPLEEFACSENPRWDVSERGTTTSTPMIGSAIPL